MGDSGGTTEITLTCARDGTPTLLRCSECQSPICPACYVRTPVGLRCPDCAAASVPPPAAYEASPTRPRWLVPAGVGVAVAIAVVVALVLGGGGGSAGVDDTSAPTATERVRVGTGDLPHGQWILEARRGDGLCATLTVSPGSPGREICRPLPRDKHMAFTSTRMLGLPSETIYLTMGMVSERTERVRVAPEGAAPWDVPVLGADLNLGGRFFVASTSNKVTTFTSLAADGSELGRIRSAPPGS